MANARLIRDVLIKLMGGKKARGKTLDKLDEELFQPDPMTDVLDELEDFGKNVSEPRVRKVSPNPGFDKPTKTSDF